MKNILSFLLLLICFQVSGQIQTINVGTAANAGNGDNLRAAFTKVNSNFTYVNLQAVERLDSLLDAGIASGATWGSITGTLSNQTDLNTALSGKVPTTRTINSQPLSGDITLTKSNIGLSNVDNTSDASKPVSTLTQTALDLKLEKLLTINTQTSSYSLVLSDRVKTVLMNSASANNLTVPSGVFAVGDQLIISQIGAGQTTIVASGVTLRSAGGKLKLTEQYAAVTLICIASNEFLVIGNLTN
jgi:hypothetical protein